MSEERTDGVRIPHVVIVGGGFGGLQVARSLRHAPVRITLIDKRNFHLFQPLLYQVATGGLSPANIAAPLRDMLKKQPNTEILLSSVDDINVEERRVVLASGRSVGYDTLVVATGATHCYFGNDSWADVAPGLKTIEDALLIRRRLLLSFEEAELARDCDEDSKHLTFAIVGGGPTGVELAGAFCEITRHTLRHEFRHINPENTRILLLERGPRVLPGLPEDLAAEASTVLKRLGAEVLTGVTVTAMDSEGVTFTDVDGKEERVPTSCLCWAAGMQASPLGKALARQTGAASDPSGRVVTQGDLTLPGHPEIFVIGDLAHYVGVNGRPLPGIAPVAMQQGKYVGRAVLARQRGGAAASFHYRDLGIMATIGRAAAVAQMGSLHLTGLLAWVAWLFVHLMHLMHFENRLLVMMQWAWSYLTWNRSARIITGDDA